MNHIFSIFFCIILVIILLKKNYKAQLVIILLSLLGDMFFFKVAGSRILLCHVVAFFSLPFRINVSYGGLNGKIRGIKLEYLLLVILGIIYGFVFPWDDGSQLRSWIQEAWWRSIVALIRIGIEISLIYQVYYLFNTKKVSLKFFLSALSILIMLVVVFALVDFALHHTLYKMIFSRADYRGLLNGSFKYIK